MKREDDAKKPTEQVSKKRTYRQPKVKSFGSMVSLTAASSGTFLDLSSGMMLLA